MSPGVGDVWATVHTGREAPRGPSLWSRTIPAVVGAFPLVEELSSEDHKDTLKPPPQPIPMGWLSPGALAVPLPAGVCPCQPRAGASWLMSPATGANAHMAAAAGLALKHHTCR